MMTVLILSTTFYVLMLLVFFIGLFFPNERKQGERHFVSVVIAARNEELTIRNLLEDLIRQSYPRDRHEIIIVDDHSSDRTAEIIRRYTAEYPNMRLVHSGDEGSGRLVAKKRAINQGIRHCRGPIILTTDADCRVQPGWIETMVSYFTEDVGMVVGFSQMGVKGERQSIFEKLQSIDFLALLSAAQGSLNFRFPLAATGQNLAYRKEVFEQVGGFEKIGHRISGDDVLLLQLIHKRTSWKIRFAPSPRAFNHTEAEKTFKAFVNQRKRWASNGSYQFRLNKVFFLIVLNTFFINLLILGGFAASVVMSVNAKILLQCLFFKVIGELLLIVKGARACDRQDLIPCAPIWAIGQIPYVVVVGLFGNMGSFIWKGRKS